MLFPASKKAPPPLRIPGYAPVWGPVSKEKGLKVKGLGNSILFMASNILAI